MTLCGHPPAVLGRSPPAALPMGQKPHAGNSGSVRTDSAATEQRQQCPCRFVCLRPLRDAAPCFTVFPAGRRDVDERKRLGASRR